MLFVPLRIWIVPYSCSVIPNLRKSNIMVYLRIISFVINITSLNSCCVLYDMCYINSYDVFLQHLGDDFISPISFGFSFLIHFCFSLIELFYNFYLFWRYNHPFNSFFNPCLLNNKWTRLYSIFKISCSKPDMLNTL